jgi:MraZ protein
MTSLRGRSHIKIDPKGRLSLPATFRSYFTNSKSVFITNGVFQGQPFLDLYAKADWNSLERTVAGWPTMKPEVQVFQRFYLSSAEACSIDGQGRILIPQHLREHAGLEEDVVLVGMGRKIEIWSEKAWRDHFSQMQSDYEKATESLASLESAKKTGKK